MSHGAEALLHYSVTVTLGGIDWRDAFITVMLWDGGRGKGSCKHSTVACSLLTYI